MVLDGWLHKWAMLACTCTYIPLLRVVKALQIRDATIVVTYDML